MFLFFALLILAVAQAILYIPLLCARHRRSLSAAFSETNSFTCFAIGGIVLPFVFAIWLLKAIFAKPRVTAARYVYVALGFAVSLCSYQVFGISAVRVPMAAPGFSSL